MDKLEELKNKMDVFEKHQLRSLPADFDSVKIELKEDNVIKGYAIVWGSRNSHDEIVLKGATLNSLNARGVGATRNKIQFLLRHDTSKPIARFLKLEEDDYGLYFEAELIDTTAANDAKKEIKGQVLRQLSYGFNYIWDKTEWSEEDEAYILREIKLWEISLVTYSSDEVAQLRATDFNVYQKIEIIKDIDFEALRKLNSLSKSNIEEKKEIKKTNENEKSNVKFF